MRLFRSRVASVEVAVAGEESFTMVLSYPRHKGLVAYRLMETTKNDLASLSESRTLTMFTSTMVTSGDPAFEFRASTDTARNAKLWRENVSKGENDTTCTMDLEAFVEIEPNEPHTPVSFVYSWPRGQGELALHYFPSIFTQENLTAVIHALVRQGDASTIKACGLTREQAKQFARQ